MPQLQSSETWLCWYSRLTVADISFALQHGCVWVYSWRPMAGCSNASTARQCHEQRCQASDCNVFHAGNVHGSVSKATQHTVLQLLHRPTCSLEALLQSAWLQDEMPASATQTNAVCHRLSDDRMHSTLADKVAAELSKCLSWPQRNSSASSSASSTPAGSAQCGPRPGSPSVPWFEELHSAVLAHIQFAGTGPVDDAAPGSDSADSSDATADCGAHGQCPARHDSHQAVSGADAPACHARDPSGERKSHTAMIVAAVGQILQSMTRPSFDQSGSTGLQQQALDGAHSSIVRKAIELTAADKDAHSGAPLAAIKHSQTGHVSGQRKLGRQCTPDEHGGDEQALKRRCTADAYHRKVAVSGVTKSAAVAGAVEHLARTPSVSECSA